MELDLRSRAGDGCELLHGGVRKHFPARPHHRARHPSDVGEWMSIWGVGPGGRGQRRGVSRLREGPHHCLALCRATLQVAMGRGGGQRRPQPTHRALATLPWLVTQPSRLHNRPSSLSPFLFCPLPGMILHACMACMARAWECKQLSQIWEAYARRQKDGDYFNAFSDLVTEGQFLCPAYRAARYFSRAGAPTHFYRFTDVVPDTECQLYAKTQTEDFLGAGEQADERLPPACGSLFGSRSSIAECRHCAPCLGTRFCLRMQPPTCEQGRALNSAPRSIPYTWL